MYWHSAKLPRCGSIAQYTVHCASMHTHIMHGMSGPGLSRPSACCRKARPKEESSQTYNVGVDLVRATAAAEQGGELGQDSSEDRALYELD